MESNFIISQENIWLNIDKPEGYSSAKIVAMVKKFTGAKKVGHAGTLDPFASGILPIALNKATKTARFIESSDKKYFFRIKWGEMTDTDDIEGKVIDFNDKRPKNIDIINVMSYFIGDILQSPSRFSAIKINGERAYNLARSGIEFEIKKRPIKIFDLKLLQNNKQFADFEVSCSKGTYIRSLARDMCLKMGVCGHLEKLIRTKVGKFSYSSRISLDKLKIISNYKYYIVNRSIISLFEILDFAEIAEVDDLNRFKFKNGQMIAIDVLKNTNLSPKNSEIVRVVHNRELIGIAKIIDIKDIDQNNLPTSFVCGKINQELAKYFSSQLLSEEKISNFNIKFLEPINVF